jgi:hypothetical protein
MTRDVQSSTILRANQIAKRKENLATYTKLVSKSDTSSSSLVREEVRQDEDIASDLDSRAVGGWLDCVGVTIAGGFAEFDFFLRAIH